MKKLNSKATAGSSHVFRGYDLPANAITGAPRTSNSQTDSPLKRETDPSTKQLLREFKERHPGK